MMHSTRDYSALIFSLLFPSLVTFVYFQRLQDYPSTPQQIAFGTGKILQFGFPVVFVWLAYRERLWAAPDSVAQSPAPETVSKNSIPLGVAFGCTVAVAMFTFFFTLFPAEVTDRLQAMVTAKVTSIGVDSTWKYLGLAVFYTFCHSFMEEYYWRWFVFDLLRRHFPTPVANVVSSVGFMAHHVIVLGFFFGWTSPLTYLLSISIAIGGSFWAWMYGRDNRLRSAWISHAIVDAAIFGLGYFLVFGSSESG